MPVKGLLDEVCQHRLGGLSAMTRDEMRLAGYPDSMPPIDICAPGYAGLLTRTRIPFVPSPPQRQLRLNWRVISNLIISINWLFSKWASSRKQILHENGTPCYHRSGSISPREEAMAEEGSCSLSEQEREPESPWSDDWREATLRRLEAWIEERERLIEEFERRIEEEANAA
jgi:hypothetical protein